MAPDDAHLCLRTQEGTEHNTGKGKAEAEAEVQVEETKVEIMLMMWLSAGGED